MLNSINAFSQVPHQMPAVNTGQQQVPQTRNDMDGDGDMSRSGEVESKEAARAPVSATLGTIIDTTA